MKRLLFLFSIASLLILSACSKDDDDTANGGGNGNQNITTIDQKPLWAEVRGNTNVSSPEWKCTFEDDVEPYSSMTAVISIDTKIANDVNEEKDRLAAFCNGKCVGVATVQNNELYGKRFFLYIQQPQTEKRDLTLCFYSDKTKQLYYWVDELEYAKDDMVGNMRKPHVLKEEDENRGYPAEIMTIISLYDGMTIDFKAGDELAVFCGDVCLKVAKEEDLVLDNFVWDIPSFHMDDKLHVRYYSAAKQKVYKSVEKSDAVGLVVFDLSPNSFEAINKQE